jgi:hypothetical protein
MDGVPISGRKNGKTGAAGRCLVSGVETNPAIVRRGTITKSLRFVIRDLGCSILDRGSSSGINRRNGLLVQLSNKIKKHLNQQSQWYLKPDVS